MFCSCLIEHLGYNHNDVQPTSFGVNYHQQFYPLQVQWNTFGGKCGVCGDRYSDPHPQDNENTGKYGLGKIAATYDSGSTISVSVLLTTNHRGYFKYRYFLREIG